MAERGKARYAIITAGSNTTINTSPGTLYRLYITPANGANVRVEGSKDLGAAPNLNASGASTIALLGTFANTTPVDYDFGPGVGFDGLTIAATSNARVNVVYE